MLTDSHCHLNATTLLPDWHKHIRDFLEQDGKGLSIIGTNIEDSTLAVELVKKIRSAYPFLSVGATIGTHPEYANILTSDQPLQDNLQQLETLYEQYQEYIIGIGEVGTDLHRDEYKPYHQTQKQLFEQQCAFAKEHHLPVVIHSRDDFEGTLEIVARYKDLNIYYHCRGYTQQELEILQQVIPLQNLRIGFCGNITYPKAQDLRDSFQYCLDHKLQILIETDSPYLAAQAIRGTTNTPAQIIHIYNYIAEYFAIAIDKLKQQTYTNFMTLYFPHAK